MTKISFQPRANLRRCLIISAAAISISQPSMRADVTLPPLISDHMVLQRGNDIRIWGKADPEEKVKASLAGTEKETTAGADGRWEVKLDLSQKAPGPHELNIEGKNRLSVKDVLIGEVWLCSGQSNMELRLYHSLGSEAEVAISDNAMLREFKVEKHSSSTPSEEAKGKWIVASAKTSQDFGGVSYYFGKTLQKSLNVPVGLVRAAWGGASLEAWMSAEALSKNEALSAGRDIVTKQYDGFPEQEKAYYSDYAAWEKKHGRQDQPADPTTFAAPDIDVSDWKKVTLPNDFSAIGLPDSGAVWFRRTIDITEDMARDGYMVLWPGFINGYHEVYWDGKKVSGSTSPATDYPGAKAVYRLSQTSKIAPGRHVMALRVFQPVGKAAVAAKPGMMKISPANFPLDGEWLAKVESTLPALDSKAAAERPRPPRKPPLVHHVASQLYNGMIAPLLPYGIRGAIWYQGESNAGRSIQHHTSFPLMIQDWRQKWGRGDIPFYFCQLANYGPKTDQPGDDAWAELNESLQQSLKLPATGMAVLLDTGMAGDIHPLNRKDQGERLGAAALAQTYGVDVPHTGPLFESMTREGNAIRIHFANAEGGLEARLLPETYIIRYQNRLKALTAPLKILSPGSEVQGFAICGEDRVWKWAQAKIDGKDVIVSSPEVPQPVAVRYAWASNPTCNLYGRDGFPAASFRTDDFPMVGNKRYNQEDWPKSDTVVTEVLAE